MQILQMIWNGISGSGSGTVILKAIFILFLGALFWMICELIKCLANILAKLAVDAMRYLAIVVRDGRKTSNLPNRTGRIHAGTIQTGVSAEYRRKSGACHGRKVFFMENLFSLTLFRLNCYVVKHP